MVYHDVTYFVSNTVEDPTKWDGKSVTIKGDLQTKRVANGAAEGRDLWIPSCVARSIEPGDESLTVAMPAGKKPVASTPAPEDDDQIPF